MSLFNLLSKLATAIAISGSPSNRIRNNIGFAKLSSDQLVTFLRKLQRRTSFGMAHWLRIDGRIRIAVLDGELGQAFGLRETLCELFVDGRDSFQKQLEIVRFGEADAMKSQIALIAFSTACCA